jgi:hypothetical protein
MHYECFFVVYLNTFQHIRLHSVSSVNWVERARKWPWSNLSYYTGILFGQFSKSTTVTLFYVKTETRHLLNRTIGVFQKRSTRSGTEKNVLSLQGINPRFLDCLAGNPFSKPSWAIMTAIPDRPVPNPDTPVPCTSYWQPAKYRDTSN